MARTLTRKQKGFVESYARTGNGSLSAKENYNVTNDASARAVASEVLTSPNVVKALADRLPDDLLNERHLELLNKRETFMMKVSPRKYKKVDLGPETNAVSKGLDMAYKVKGSYAPEKSTSLNLNVEARIADKTGMEALRKEYEEKLKAKLVA